MDGSRRDARDVIELQLQALRIVLAVLRGRSLTATLEQRAVTPGTGAHSAAVQDLAYGVLRHLGTLRAVLAGLLAKPLHDDDLEALLLVADKSSIYLVSGNGDVIEPDEGIAAIGSGGPFALSAGLALLRNTKFSAKHIVEQAMAIAGKICIYTNDSVTFEELE